MDKLTEKYRGIELMEIKKTKYSVRLVIYDGLGNKTKFLSVTDKEYDAIKNILIGKD